MNELIIISGPSGVGKTTVAKHLARRLYGYGTLGQDSFCFDRSYILKDHDFYAVDHEKPEIIDHQLAAQCIACLRSGSSAVIPIYSHSELRRSGHQTVPPGNIIYEGLHSLYDDRLIQTAGLRVFLDAPKAMIYQRRLQRDIRCRNVDPARYDHYFRNYVWPGFERYVRSAMYKADLVIDGCQESEETVERILCEWKN